MKGAVHALWLLCIALLSSSPAVARESKNIKIPVRASSTAEAVVPGPGIRGLYESAVVDTYCIVNYSFETGSGTPSWQGWTRVDNTAQVDTFFHVENFDWASGGDFGRLVPIQGSQSIWCGVRPNPADPYLCSWAQAPGYGNKWDQTLTYRDWISSNEPIIWSFRCVYDTEPGYDVLRAECMIRDMDEWTWDILGEFSGIGDTLVSYVLPTTEYTVLLRFHFISDEAWSDQDGLWNTDGGVIIDSIMVVAEPYVADFENFEMATPGAKGTLKWRAATGDAYGCYSGLITNLNDKDPCNDNFGSQVAFFVGSPYPSTEYPGLYDTPFCAGSDTTAQCQDEMIVSPVIRTYHYSSYCNEVQDVSIPIPDFDQINQCFLQFTVYCDLPLENLVFYQWHVRSIVDGCPGLWQDHGSVYYNPGPAYIFNSFDVTAEFLDAEYLQIALGAVDLCAAWYPLYGPCSLHTPAPLLDNAKLLCTVKRPPGPVFKRTPDGLFLDNKQVDSNPVRTESRNTVARKRNPYLPKTKDYIDLICTPPRGRQIAILNGKPKVYMHVRVIWDTEKNDDCPPPGGPITGESLNNDNPPPECTFVEEQPAEIGDPYGNWSVMQGTRHMVINQRNTYWFDINDNLFPPGYTIEYYFVAEDDGGGVTRFPSKGAFEFNCLPFKKQPCDGELRDALAAPDITENPRILFIDSGNSELFWRTAFQAVLPDSNQPDFYRVSAPSDIIDGPFGYLEGAALADWYDIIIWDVGEAECNTICDGSLDPAENDCAELLGWLNNSAHPCGLWICGDNVAYDLDRLGSSDAVNLMSSWCGVTLVAKSYFDLTGGLGAGGVVNPLVKGEADAGVFVHGGVPDHFYQYGGCPIINEFDVLGITGTGEYALAYPDFGGSSYFAGIAAENTNPLGHPVKTMWFGFSLKHLRDDQEGQPIDRFEIVRDVLDWMGVATKPDITDTEIPTAAFALAQNYPNPFNPHTLIGYDMKEKGLVRLAIYSVAGQRVRTLVDEVKPAGSYSVLWNGENDRGAKVASGIYFCKMESGDFRATRKIVLLR